MSPLFSSPSASPEHSSTGKYRNGLSLKTKLTGVMLLTVSAIAAIVHFPWAYTSRQNVNDMVGQLNGELMRGTENEVSNLFQNILAAKELIQISLDEGLIQLNEPEDQGQFYLNLLLTHENFTWVQFGFANGDYLGAQRRADGLYSIIQRQWDETLGELGEPGTALAERQAERAARAQQFKQTQECDPEFEQATKTVQTFRFNAQEEWQKVEETTSEEIYYAPIRPFYEAAIAQPGEDVWTDVYVFRTGNAVGLDATTTYQESPESPIQGVISISFELRQISSYLASLKEVEQGVVFIINPEGFLIASSNPEALAETFVSEDTADLMPIAKVEDPLLQVANKAFAENDIVLENLIGLQEISYYDPDTGQRYYVALKPLGHLDWVVGTVTPESFFLQRINRSKRRLLVAIVLFLGLGSLAAVWLSDRAIAKPILAISDAAEAIENGNFTAIALDEMVKRNDELGKLSRVFQTMAKEVYAREQSLKRQLQALKIEIDESRKNREVREIVDTDFFRDLKVKAQNLRQRNIAAEESNDSESVSPAETERST